VPYLQEGDLRITNLSRKYEATLRAVSNDALLPQVELGIIHTLGTESEPQFAGTVAGELDCSYQLVLARRGRVCGGVSSRSQGRLASLATAAQTPTSKRRSARRGTQLPARSG